MKIPPVRGKISILRGGNVMPMKLFVRCMGDLATVGGSVLVVTSFSRSVILSFFVCEDRELVSLFYPGDSLTLWPS